MRLVLATHNAHKVDEFRRLLSVIPTLEVVGYDGPEPVEYGTTFLENAAIKAEAAADATGELALADDSGITVNIMGGAPGIFSARWAGKSRSDEANRALLLEQIADVPDAHRGAAFVCALVVAGPSSAGGRPAPIRVEGRWQGSIAASARGEQGFGYDPVFIPAGRDVTAAELAPAEKDALSHRARAVERLVPLLRTILSTG